MTQTLTPRNVAFYGDEIIAVQQHDGAIYMLFSRMCENIGRPRVTETRRVEQHVVLSKGLVELPIQTAGGAQNLLCLRLDLLPLWLASIPSSRLKDDVKDKVVRYQTEAASVLWQAFKGQIVREDADELASTTDAELAQLQQIVDMGHAIVRMAQEQIEQRRRMDIAARVVKGLQTNVADIQVRLGVLEDKANPAAYISDAQASEVLIKVKALAEWLTTQDKSKNHYQSIYTELYRRFNVAGYKLLRQEQFDSVLAFLDDWQRAGETNA